MVADGDLVRLAPHWLEWLPLANIGALTSAVTPVSVRVRLG